MQIDNRLFIIPGVIFGTLALIRVVWFLAGAPWTMPEVAALFSTFFGVIIGGFITGILFLEEVDLGKTTIFKRR